ncbi:MAG: hypothetical protein REI09_15515, partial [Candidatus Dactylopiibacterium sp.]|nr:hypothetical protein [Candidatus Dactylopiibacterium sp.]
MIVRLLGGMAALFLSAAAYAATDYPSGYTKCAQNTGATCSMSGTRSVALGKSGSFVYATKTGSFACTGSAFPSNSFTESAWCSYSGSTSSSSSSSSSSSAGGTIPLSASGGSGRITLNWSGTSAGSVEVYRDTDADPSGRVRIASVAAGTTSYVDSTVSANVTYYYWIKNTVNGVVSNSSAVSARASSGSSSSSSSSSTPSGSINTTIPSATG